jgi:hypothetical protein
MMLLGFSGALLAPFLVWLAACDFVSYGMKLFKI